MIETLIQTMTRTKFQDTTLRSLAIIGAASGSAFGLVYEVESPADFTDSRGDAAPPI